MSQTEPTVCRPAETHQARSDISTSSRSAGHTHSESPEPRWAATARRHPAETPSDLPSAELERVNTDRHGGDRGSVAVAEHIGDGWDRGESAAPQMPCLQPLAPPGTDGTGPMEEHMHTQVLETITEAQFQDTVTGMMDAYSWVWIHHRPARTKKQTYVTPVAGSGARGFPDLFATRGHEAVAWECKSQGGRVRPEQTEWITRLNLAGIESRVIRPSDLDWIEDRLRPDPVQLAMDTTITTTNSTGATWLPITTITEGST